MAYTINANAKNVWIRDNEDTRDLSIQTDASSVYLDNGRTLEQELGEGSMVSNVATVDTSMSKVIDGTLDGVYESGVMYGRTLVNSIGTLGNFRKYSDIYFYCDTKGLIKPSAKYYYQIKNLPSNCRFCIGNSKSSTETFFSYQAYSLQGTVTTKTTQPDESVRVWIYRVDDTTNDLVEVLNEIELVFIEYQEGMENWDISFFEGICDVKMPILRNVGKNLFDGEWEAGGYDISGNKTDHNLSIDIRSKNYIPIAPNTTYVFSNNGELRATHVREYNNDYKFVASKNTVSKFTTDSNTRYITVYGAKENRDRFQIEETSTPTPTTYEDHKTNILRTPEEIILREVGGVQDTYNPLTGEYVQRIGEIVLSGSSSEQWNFSSLSSDRTKVGFYILSSNITPQPKVSSVTVNNKLPLLPENAWGSKSHEGCYIGSNALAIVVNTSKLSTPDVEGIRTYLQSNPVTVQYQLATPITTIVESLTTPFAYENGHIILESGYEGQSLLPTLEYSTVVNKTGQVESVAKVIQKQEKQLTMLEQMLIQNIIGLDYNNTVLALNLEINEVM